MRISDWSSDVCSSDLVARYSRFINSLRASIICRCFLKLDPVFPRAAPIWLLESGSFQGVIMAKIKLTKTAVEAAQPQTKDVELRATVVPGFLCKITPTGRRDRKRTRLNSSHKCASRLQS